jgi:hypothetical protein
MTDLYHIEKKKLLFAEPATVIIEDGGKTVISLNERFRIVDYKARLLIKPPKWMIPDFLVEDSYAMIFGATGTFKTFLALDIALQVATGGAGDTAMWPKVIAQGKVLFIAGEGRAAVAKRVTAWEKIHNKGEPVKEFYLGDPVPMISEALEPFLKAALEMSSDGYKLVVIDTISRAMAGSNDNSAEYATQFTAMVQEMQKELHCTVLALHHTGHQGDHARGSSVFHNEPDTIMRVEREPKSKIVSLLVKKQKDGVEWEDERYALLQHHPIAGDPEGTLVVVKGSRDTAATKSGKGMTPERYKNTQAVNAAVLRVVKRERQKKGGWTNNAMALACAADEDVNISDSTIDRAIATIRNDKSKWSAGHAYDGPDGKWAWKYLPDSKRDRFNV